MNTRFKTYGNDGEHVMDKELIQIHMRRHSQSLTLSH